MRTLSGRAGRPALLASLHTLARLTTASSRLASDTPLVVELSEVLNYTLRTQDDCLGTAVLAVFQGLLGEEGPGLPGEQTSLQQGASPLYGALEAIAAVILRKLPGLDPASAAAGDELPAPLPPQSPEVGSTAARVPLALRSRRGPPCLMASPPSWLW